MKFKKTFLSLALTFILSQSYSSVLLASSVNSNEITPHPAVYGYFVDEWKNNNANNMSPSTNPAIGVLSGYLKLWKPGTSYNNGIKLNSDILNLNIQKVIQITSRRTSFQEHQAYFDDRRNQNYSVLDGLGPYNDAFIKEAGAGTTITDVIPKDAINVQYTDKGNTKGNWAEESSNLGSVVKLVDTIRNSAASTTPAKNYYKYPRPWRWSDKVKVLPTLVPEKSTNPSSDGGFPSGHTNAATIDAIALAYAVPERYQEMLTRASELGNDRIVAGMHSPLDVIGGRVMATAIATSALNNRDNTAIKNAAYLDAQTKLITKENAISKDRFSNYSENKKNYTQRLTYDFPEIGDKNKPMVVPKGAEVLLETRFPYLDAENRRWILYTTGIPSGYPVLDDSEGWGRINLFAAADGYASFVKDVTVTMDASKGGFNAEDSWINDISGNGKLIKNGTGKLKLKGDNKYRGGTEINGGDLEADSKKAFGDGDVVNNSGILTKEADKLNIRGKYVQLGNGTLELNIDSKNDVLRIKDEANFNGVLKLNFLNGYVPTNKEVIIKCGKIGGRFSSVATAGLPSGDRVNILYKNDQVVLQVVK
ncbi:phospholipid phosphatase [Clostridium acetobutylicum]|nr:phospholipid phosphatase [Clostridium acetobutylicum]